MWIARRLRCLAVADAMRRLRELLTVRAGIIGNRTEWKSRIGIGDSTRIGVVAATFKHSASQLEANESRGRDD